MVSLPTTPTPEAEAEVLGLARAAARGVPGLVSVVKAGGPEWAWDLFDRELVVTVRADPALRAAWADGLSVLVVEAARQIEDAADARDRPAVRAMLDEWSNAADPLEAWRNDHLSNLVRWCPVYGRAGRLLVRMAPAIAARTLEQSRHPGLLWMALEAQAGEPLLDDLLAILRDAEVAYRPDGAWLDRRMIAMAALSRLQDRLHSHAMSLETAVRCARDEAAQVEALGRRREWHRTSVPALCEEISATLLSRPDGLHIAVAFGAHLETCLALRQRNVPLPEATREDVVDATAEVLRDTLARAVATRHCESEVRAAVVRWLGLADEIAAVRRGRRRAISSEEEERGIPDSQGEGRPTAFGEGLGVVFFAILVEQRRPETTEADCAALWGLLVERVAGGDRGLHHQLARASRPIERCAGWLLSRLAHPMAELQKAYVALEPCRRRARYGVRYRGSSANEGSLFLLCAALRSVEAERGRGELGQDAVARMNWFTVEVRRLWLTAVLDVEELAERVLVLGFAFATLFRPPERESLVRAMLEPLSSRPDLGARGLSMVVQNGVTRDDVLESAAQAGIDLEGLQRRVERLLDLGFLSSRHEQALVEAFERLGSDRPLKWTDPRDVSTVAP